MKLFNAKEARKITDNAGDADLNQLLIKIKEEAEKGNGKLVLTETVQEQIISRLTDELGFVFIPAEQGSDFGEITW